MGSEEAVPGPSVLPSRVPGLSRDFWGLQEGCQGPFRPSALGSGVGPLEGACPELEWLPASRQSPHRKEESPAPPGGYPRRTRCSLRDKDVIKLLVLLDVSACPGLVGGVRVPGRMEASGQSPFHMFCPKGKPLPLPPHSC